MNCEYWKNVAHQLYDLEKCNWASHVLSTQLIFNNMLGESRLNEAELREVNLGIALECVSQEEIIKGTIYAYRDWSAQPNCDLILAQFEADKIRSIFRELISPTDEMKKGVEFILEETNSAS